MKKINFDRDWKFKLGNFSVIDSVGQTKSGIYNKGVSSRNFDDSSWEIVTLPHDYRMNSQKEKSKKSAENMADIPAMEKIDSHLTTIGAIIGKPAWYRKSFSLSKKEYSDKEVFIKFDGAFKDYTVYLNNYYIGNHQSGYTECVYNITDFIDFDNENVISIKINPSESEGWWYEGAGLYRHVWLLSAPSTHFDIHGVFVKSDVDLENNTAVLEIDSTIIFNDIKAEDISIEHKIFDNNNNLVAKISDSINNMHYGENTHSIKIDVHSPLLWSTESPNMYKIVSSLSNGDVFKDNFGIRKIEFHNDLGFLLNGKQYKIKGMCLHQDHAGVGVAHFDGLHQFRIDLLKEMGCNAVRTSHNNPAPEFLDCCDKNGILVMDENRIQSTDNEHLQQFKTMLLRDRNHPSVIIYSIGNEENLIQHTDNAARIAKRLKNVAHTLDGTRPITTALIYWDFVNLKNIVDPKFCDSQIEQLDVIGMNYCFGIWDEMHKTYPDLPFISTEVSSFLQTRGVYYDNKNRCQVGAFRSKQNGAYEYLKLLVENDYLSGIFVWTGFDYHGEPTPYGWPAVISQFGVYDLCGFKKDEFYAYKAAWCDEPVLHIAPHWNWIGNEDSVKEIGCYTNCDEVEVFLNGKSLGKKSSEKFATTFFDVKYEPGELIAKGYINGKLVITDTQKTTKHPVALSLKLSASYDDPNGETYTILTACALDEDGLCVPDAQNHLEITLSDGLKIAGVGNGNPFDHMNERACFVTLFNGLAQIIVKNDTALTGEKTVKISTPSLKTAEYKY